MELDHQTARLTYASARLPGAQPLMDTQDFAALHDHARLPWRFFGRFTASVGAGLPAA